MTFEDCQAWIQYQARLYRYVSELPDDPVLNRDALAHSMGDDVAASLDAEAQRIARDVTEALPDLPDPDPYDVDIYDVAAA